MPLSKYDIKLDLEQHPDTSHANLVDMVGSNKRVLDVGCDTGYLGEALAALGNSTVGVEINPVTAEEAAKKLERVVVGDLESIDLLAEFGPASFDVVVFGDVLEHLRDPLPLLRQARPLLKPGGSVLISTPNIAHGDIRLALLKGQFRYTKVGILDETHTKFFTKDALAQFLDDAGFVLSELRRTRAELFSTEVGVREEDYPAELVATLRDDIEATTYQFVARGVPDDAATVESSQALLVDDLRSQLETERKVTAQLRGENDQLAQQVAEFSRRLDATQAAHDAAVKQRDHAAEMYHAARDEATRLRRDLDALLASALMRYTKPIRVAWSRRHGSPEGKSADVTLASRDNLPSPPSGG